MSRKRKQKKSKPGSDGPWTATGRNSSGEVSGIGVHPSEIAPASEPAKPGGPSDKNNLAGAAREGIRLEAEMPSAGDRPPRGATAAEQSLHSPQPGDWHSLEPEQVVQVSNKLSESDQESISGSDRESSYTNQSPPEGFFEKILQWWRGPSAVPVGAPSNAPGDIGAQRIPTPPPAGRREPSGPVSSGRVSEPPGPSSQVDKVHAVLMLERVLPELDEAKRQLQQERESAQARIRDLENERDRIRSDAERTRFERGDIEGHTNMLRKSVAALERQLQEERGTAAKNAEESEARIRSFEDSIKNSRSLVPQLRAELEDSQEQRERLESLVERYKEELETNQRQLQEERDVARGRIEQLESELSRKSGAGDMVRSERNRIEERAGLVQKALEVMEQQLREEREAASKQILQLETELKQVRAKSSQMETRVGTLLGELEKSKGRARKKGAAPEPEPEENTALTTRSAGRIQELESELATGSSALSPEKQTTTTRISRLESRWEDLKSRLLPKDREIGELRQQADEFRAQIDALEAALAEARTGSDATAAEDDSGKLATVLLPLDRQAVESLYSQSMGKLTVLMASADILMMNTKLDAKVLESLQEIKTQGQSLLDLIKSFTLPPEAKKSQ